MSFNNDGPMSVQLFKELANNTVLGIPDGNVFSWCSQMELLAISMNKTSIWIFRIDGERVYSINNKVPILDFQWSVDGEYFVCSGTDRAIKVYDTNTGAILNTFQTHDTSPITLLSWHSFHESRSDNELQDLTIAIDLSRLNIHKCLPKLSSELSPLDQQHNGIPIHKIAETSKQTHLDTDSWLDFLLAINENCSMSLVFKNAFVVSNIELPKGYNYLEHRMRPDFFTQNFVAKDENNNLHLLECDVNVKGDQKRRDFFKVVELTVQMVSTINHLNDQLSAITKGANDYISLLDRYLSNYNDSIEVTFETTNEVGLLLPHEQIVLNLSDIVLTGLVPESCIDFWLNQFGTRGLNRLSTVGNASYDFAREVIFAQIILAVEKLIIIISDMQSIANSDRYFQQDSFGISIDHTKQAISYLKGFIGDVYDFVWSMNEEQESFNKFLNWCQVEILEKLTKKDTDPEGFFKSHPTLDFNSSLIINYLDKCLFTPIFVQKLPIDPSSYEVLVRNTVENGSLSPQLNLSSGVFSHLQNGVEKFISSIFIFKEPFPIGIVTTAPSIEYGVYNESSLISAIEHNRLHISKLTKGLLYNHVVEFPNQVLCNVIFNEDKVLVLYEESVGAFRLDMCKIDWNLEDSNHKNMKRVWTSCITSESYVSNPAMVSIACPLHKSKATGILVDKTMRKYSVIEI